MPTTTTRPPAEAIDPHELVKLPLEAVNDAESNILLMQDHFAVLEERFRMRDLPVNDVKRAMESLRDAHLAIRKTRGHLERAGGAK